jgi:RNA polymerase sigma-70 factor, ECF subfamily
MDTSVFRLAVVTTPRPEARNLADTSAEISFRSADLSDEVLLHQVNQGNGGMLDVLFRRYARLVRSIAYKILRDASEADDVLQEVFLFIYRKSELFDMSKSSARSWIVQVTYHRAIDRRRYLQSRHFYTHVDLEDVIRGLEDGGPNTDAIECGDVQKLFNTLSENQRQTLQLFFYEGLTLNEIALKLGQTRGNVKNHYFRGLDKLRKQLLHRNPAPDSGV